MREFECTCPGGLVERPPCIGCRANAAIREAVAEATSKAVDLAVRYGGIDGDHHKAWVIDQMVRALTGDGYARVIAEAKAGEDGPETYEWDVGIAP